MARESLDNMKSRALVMLGGMDLKLVLAVFVTFVTVCGVSADGGPLWEDVAPAQVPEVWRQLSNETVVYPMRMAYVARTIGSERQLFLDNDLIASAEHIAREVHEPRRYKDNPIMMADPRVHPREIIRVLHVLQSNESPRFRMWYHALPAFYEWKGDQRIRYGTSYAISEDGIHWERPELDLYHPVQRNSDGGNKGPYREKNVVMPYGMMDGLFYEPWEDDPNKRYKAIVSIEAVHTDTEGRMTKEASLAGWYLHWSPDGIHWQGDLSRPVLVEGAGYVYPPNGIGDTTRFWWDPLRKKYIGDVKWVLPGVIRCRGIMESDDLVHWTRPVPVFFAREPGHQIYGHIGFAYQGLYIGFREIFDKHYMNDPMVHSADVELDCSRDGKTWTRVGAGQPFMSMNPDRNTWDADEARPVKPLVVGDELWIYYSSRLSPVVYTNMFKNKSNPRGHQQDIFSLALAKLRMDGFASLNAGAEPGTIVTRPLTFEGKKLYVNAEVAEGGHLKVELRKLTPGVRDRSSLSSKPFAWETTCSRPEDAVEPYTAENCNLVTGDKLRTQVTWKDRRTIEHSAKESLRVVFKLKNAKLYSFWIE